MKGVWRKISFNGINQGSENLGIKELIILNQINFLILVTFTISFLILLPEEIAGGLQSGGVRILLIIALSICNLVLNSYKQFTITKYSIAILLPFLLLVLPTLIGNVFDEYFFWYPYAAITFSIIPHFIFNYQNEKKRLFSVLLYYFFIILIIDHLLFIFSNKTLLITQIVKDNFFWVKTIQVFLFLFVNIAFYHSLNLAKKLELSLRETNTELNEHKDELEEKNCELESVIFKLKETQAQLFQADKMAAIGVLASGVAHEINNPLNYISGSIQAIKQLIDDCENKNKEPEEVIETINNIKSFISDSNNGIEKVTEIVNSLMTFSYRGESQVLKTDINKLIDSTILLTQTKIPSQIKIEKDLSSLPMISVHRDDIYQLFYNIIDNAVFAIKSKGNISNEKIIFKTIAEPSTNSGSITIVIANTGPLIPEDIISKIFDPFFSTKEPDQGTGLGLSICYNIVKDHQGSISARNNENLVEFIIDLPII